MDIQDNEFFTLLGPSGCGKTTLLRMIAGFEEATAGTIRLFGEPIGDLPPNKRPINTVFQNYALFPHMTVADNVAFGLRMLGVGRNDIDSRVAEMLELVQLAQFSHRRPSELSGGQQQRVAMARSLAPHPKVLLLDEPLSALDLKLRQAMRVELKRIQRDAGITFIFVTHDQEEALAMSDRIAVIADGTLQQVGSPNAIYESPRNRFVAKFIGDANLLDIEIQGIDVEGLVTCRTDDGAEVRCRGFEGAPTAGPAQVSIRPERLSIETNSSEDLLDGRVKEVIYLGTDTQVVVENESLGELVVRVQNAHTSHVDVNQGDRVYLRPDPGEAQLLIA